MQGVAPGKLGELPGEETMPKVDWSFQHLSRKSSGLNGEAMYILLFLLGEEYDTLQKCTIVP